MRNKGELEKQIKGVLQEFQKALEEFDGLKQALEERELQNIPLKDDSSKDFGKKPM